MAVVRIHDSIILQLHIALCRFGDRKKKSREGKAYCVNVLYSHPFSVYIRRPLQEVQWNQLAEVSDVPVALYIQTLLDRLRCGAPTQVVWV